MSERGRSSLSLRTFTTQINISLHLNVSPNPVSDSLYPNKKKWKHSQSLRTDSSKDSSVGVFQSLSTAILRCPSWRRDRTSTPSTGDYTPYVPSEERLDGVLSGETRLALLPSLSFPPYLHTWVLCVDSFFLSPKSFLLKTGYLSSWKVLTLERFYLIWQGHPLLKELWPP